MLLDTVNVNKNNCAGVLYTCGYAYIELLHSYVTGYQLFITWKNDKALVVPYVVNWA